ncbi:bifunctional metallophosphatase/5'-nucleotidase [Adhaeribacter rhizoryzae]|uniref:Bifunctional metallophosphatase/5'-nucleotidase n=1 Tax=Adhaeribacter rhizoryzae TaxID=2607907 RepID=A0A5M6CX37_9BACT|nr:metallophosphatase [Adhaeribacter rhizoryzae]KAA5539791.1 bifunctional metallophosphatase/5'-nucleotidase [Adhaeribacter rhizoryzae]
MNRRDFIRNTVAGAAGLSLLGVPTPTWAADHVRLTILHTNDVHSRIDPYPMDGRPNAGLGGMARRAHLVKQIRSQEKNVLLLDSGDIWQGTPYFNLFDGELEYKLMTQMQYDAATLGNHDFDNGLAGLQRQLPNAGFPFLTANYDFSGTVLKGRFRDYKTFEKENIKIGIFGLGIELAGLVDTRNYGQTIYLDPLQRAAEMVKQLRAVEKCQLVICLSHLGYDFTNEPEKVNDQKLAHQVAGIDVILGGHSHLFMPEPKIISHADGTQTLINQVGKDGLFLGRLDFTFNRRSKTKNSVASAVVPVGSLVKTS